MALQKFQIGVFDDGSPHYHYHAPDGHVVLTGPHVGAVKLRDGAVYDVTDTVIEVETPEHAAELVKLLDARALPVEPA